MLSLAARAAAVCAAAWRRLPPCTRAAQVTEVLLQDLGAKHGLFAPDTRRITLHRRLFTVPVPLIDVQGLSPAQTAPYTSYALHTALHEGAHAIGHATGLDRHPEWLRLSGWRKTPYDRQDTDRYYEARPGWESGFSEWRHAQGIWFWRDYSRCAPAEAFADDVALISLGWTACFTGASGQAKLAWLRARCWGVQEPPLRAAVQAWHAHERQVHAAVTQHLGFVEIIRSSSQCRLPPRLPVSTSSRRAPSSGPRAAR